MALQHGRCSPGAQPTFRTGGIFTGVSVKENICSELQRLCLVKNIPCLETS